MGSSGITFAVLMFRVSFARESGRSIPFCWASIILSIRAFSFDWKIFFLCMIAPIKVDDKRILNRSKRHRATRSQIGSTIVDFEFEDGSRLTSMSSKVFKKEDSDVTMLISTSFVTILGSVSST